MELKIEKYNKPQAIEFNFEELKQELAEKVKMYETLVYTDDQIKEAKADRASLNKLKTALNDERLRLEREYMQPFNEFKEKIGQIIAIIDRPVYLIDKQVKEYEKVQKENKKKEIETVFDGLDKPEWVKLEQLFNEKWLNASVSMKSVTDDLAGKLEAIKNDLATLSNLPEFGFEASEVYKTTLDINLALNEGRRLAEIQKRKEEQERLRKEAEERARAEAEAKKLEEAQQKPVPEDFMNPPVEEEQAQAQWINFSAFLTVAQAVELREFFERRKIEFKAI